MATTAGQPRGRQRNALRNPVTWVIVLGVALAGGAYLLYRRNRNANAANASTAAPPPSTEDFAGQIATLQSEIADLQSTFAQGEGSEKPPATGGGGDTGGDDGGEGGGGGKLTAPAGLSITPHGGYADFGWDKVPGAKAYELQVKGAGGRGTGASHYDHAGTGNHAERVRLSTGSYEARVRAGKSVTSLNGPWTPWKGFHVSGVLGVAGRPGAGSGRLVTGRVGSNGSSGESENDTGSG